ncbi:WD40-repeat-containing domain protein [Mycena vitilis]|nr:WD40-repeat-containing domain protein [Mycena vitilis]
MAATPPTFQQLKTIEDHMAPINALQFSPDGHFLASGGDDQKVIIYSTKTWSMVRQYGVDFNVQAIAWDPLAKENAKMDRAISFGGDNGLMKTVQTENHSDKDYIVPGPIHTLTIEKDGKMLLVGYSNTVSVARKSGAGWVTDPTIHIAGSSFPMDTTVATHFRSKTRILVTYMQLGIAYYDLTLSTMLWRLDIGGLCGESALSPNLSLMATTVIHEGTIRWHHITSDSQIPDQMAQTSLPLELFRHILLPVIFIDPSTIIVGSELGSVSVSQYKRDAIEEHQILQHGTDIIQTLAYWRGGQRRPPFLATGGSDAWGNSELRRITIWKVKPSSTSKSNRLAPWLFMAGAAIAAALVARPILNDNVQRSLRWGRQIAHGLSGSVPERTQVRAGVGAEKYVIQVAPEVIQVAPEASDSPQDQETTAEAS